jgi:hypothetical protein
MFQISVQQTASFTTEYVPFHETSRYVESVDL